MNNVLLKTDKHKCYPLNLDWEDCYKTFLKEYPKERKWEKLYELSLKFINKEIQNELIKGKIIKLPFGLGFFSINKFLIGSKNKEKRLNFQETIKQGKRVYYLNEHTNGYYYFVNWVRAEHDKTFHRKMKCYKFLPIAGLRKKLTRAITEDFMDYPAIKPFVFKKRYGT